VLFDGSDELERALDRFEAEPGLRPGLAQAGRKAFAEHWSERVVVPRYLDVVRRAAQRTNRPALVRRLEGALA
jgi:hypothetical protein